VQVRFDQKTDVVYVNLTDRDIAETEEVADGVMVDYDAEGRIVGIEILDASRRTGDPAALSHVSFDLPSNP
jgi:YD repeat-containing protein